MNETTKKIFSWICNIIIIAGLAVSMYDVYSYQKNLRTKYQLDMEIVRQLALSLKTYSKDVDYINAASDKIVERTEIELEGYQIGGSIFNKE